MRLTSITRPLRIDSVTPNCCNGVIGMTLCPGKKEANAISGNWDRDLDADLKVISDWDTSALVSLMEEEEMAWYGVADLPGKAIQFGMKHYHLPIIDMDVPDEDFEESWQIAGGRLRKLLLSGENIVIHCLGGLGRTGTIAGRLLVELGIDPDTAIRLIRTARPGAIQTIMQEAYVRRCVKILD
ncbi:MAG: cyclin-dependent kinase inhibitor 3 family protein [Gammaproteobacteria bacterium]